MLELLGLRRAYDLAPTRMIVANEVVVQTEEKNECLRLREVSRVSRWSSRQASAFLCHVKCDGTSEFKFGFHLSTNSWAKLPKSCKHSSSLHVTCLLYRPDERESEHREYRTSSSARFDQSAVAAAIAIPATLLRHHLRALRAFSAPESNHNVARVSLNQDSLSPWRSM